MARRTEKVMREQIRSAVAAHHERRIEAGDVRLMTWIAGARRDKLRDMATKKGVKMEDLIGEAIKNTFKI